MQCVVILVYGPIDLDADFHRKILFSDEAHFLLNGYVNKQNCRIWSEENPHETLETPLHPQKLTVWCALWAEGMIGPDFFKNEAGHNVTVNGECFRAMINDFFVPKLEDVDVDDICQRNNQFIEGNFCGVASKIVRFNTAALLYM